MKKIKNIGRMNKLLVSSYIKNGLPIQKRRDPKKLKLKKNACVNNFIKFES